MNKKIHISNIIGLFKTKIFMKKKAFLLITILIYLALKTNVNAQKFYTGFVCGYGVSIASQNLTSKIENGIAQSSNVLVRGSFGRGLFFGGQIGYNRNDNIAFELGISYLKGHSYKGYYKKELDFDQETTLSANMFRLSPRIRISVGEGKIKSYAKIGAVIRVFGKITVLDTHYDIQSNTTTETEWKYSDGFSLGVDAAIGISKSINEKISISGEIMMINQTWGPKKGRITKYSIDGIDMLSNLTPYQKETDYLNSYTTSGNAPSASYSPRQQLRQYYPFSSIGINIGINLKFGKN